MYGRYNYGRRDAIDVIDENIKRGLDGYDIVSYYDNTVDDITSYFSTGNGKSLL